MNSPAFLFVTGAFCFALSHHPALYQSKTRPVSINGDRCFELNGKKIFLTIKGEGKTSVVFVSALGEDHTNWKEVQEAVATSATAMSYDRSGLGISEYNPRSKKDAVSMAEELHNIIVNQQIKRPFVIVSHSLGCTIAKVYCNKYPHDISGAVYVDPPPNPDQLKKEAGDSLWSEREKAIKQYTPTLNQAQQEEYDLQHLSYRQADKARKLPAVPTVLLTATLIYPDFPASALELKVKKESHAKWLSEMKDGRQIFVPESRHYVQTDAPQIVINAIKQVMAKQ